MKSLVRPLLTTIALAASFGSASADGDVSFIWLPAMSKQSTQTKSFPGIMKIVNRGPAATGMVYVGTDTYRIGTPFQVPDHGIISFPTYNPLYPTQRFAQYPYATQSFNEFGDRIYNNFPGILETTISLDAQSATGASHNTQKFSLASTSAELVDISLDKEGLNYLTENEWIDFNHKLPKNKSEVNLDSTSGLRTPMTVAFLAPGRRVERLDAFLGDHAVFLGHGSQKISDAEVNVLKEFVLDGGTLAFSANPDSAIRDARWTEFVGKAGVDSRLGLGRVVNLGFDPEQLPPSQNIRFQFAKRVLEQSSRKFDSSSLDLREDERQFASNTASNPFTVQLPSFGEILTVILAYFFMVIPVNYLVLRKFNRQELLWLTAPILAVGFAALMFRSSRQLYQSPASVAADGVMVCADESPNCVLAGQFDIYTPRAGTYNLKVDNAIGIDLSETSLIQRIPPRHPDEVDTGFVNVPSYQSSQLQYRGFDVLKTLANPHLVDFKLSAHKSWHILSATNHSKVSIDNATLVAGQYSISHTVLRPGETISLPIYHVHKKQATTGTTGNSVQDGRTAQVQDLDTNVQAEGRVALIGNEDNYPIGPTLDSHSVSRSKLTVCCFAPHSMILP